MQWIWWQDFLLLLLIWKCYWWSWIKTQVDKCIAGINVVKVLRLLMTNTLWNQASGASVVPLSKIKVMLVFHSLPLVCKMSQVWIWKKHIRKMKFQFFRCSMNKFIFKFAIVKHIYIFYTFFAVGCSCKSHILQLCFCCQTFFLIQRVVLVIMN